ncbi:MAG: LCP family protein [Clostridiales bacterium]|nr:LCP family protein [Clostridiales bacterium]
MKLIKGTPNKKIIIVILIPFIIALLALSLIVFLFIQSYINKMNLVERENISSHDETHCAEGIDINDKSSILLDKSVQDQIIDEVLEDEDVYDSSIVDASREEIDLLAEKLRANMEENQTPIMEDKDVLNILLIGSDTRKAGGNGRSDAMIIVSINKKTKTITATSVLRDIYLQIPGKKNNRLNAAYVFGGADLLMETIEQNLRIELNRYASVDFYAFIDVIDELGGITLEVTENEIAVINNYVTEINYLIGEELTLDHLLEPGLLMLNSKQALGYARNRYIGNSDFERTARQRRVLEQIFSGVKDLNLIELNDLVNILLPQVTTNLTKGEIFSLILGLPSYANYDLQQWRIPIDGSYSNMRIGGMAVLGVDFQSNIDEIERRIYGEINN